MEVQSLSLRELRRYRKQIMIPGIGIEGQEKLKKASVLVIGAGGMGCPVLQYLAAAGIGKIGIVEFDFVDETNLHRQILYGSGDPGKLKSVIAKLRLEQLNPLIVTEVFNLRLDKHNAPDCIREYDIIVDATDNFETRYVINDACVILNKPMVHGAIYKFEGQVSVFNYHDGPTYRCYNPQQKDTVLTNQAPSETGLFGVLPGITGTIMAIEVLKIITGTGTVLSGKLLLFNILDYSFHLIQIRNNPENHNIKMDPD